VTAIRATATGLCQAREKGETLAAIANRHGITRERLKQICHKCGAKPPPRSPRIELGLSQSIARFENLNDDEGALLRRVLGSYVDNALTSNQDKILAQALCQEVPSPSKGIKRRFGVRLKKARERAGYKSAERFAKKLGIHPARYRQWERGRAEPEEPDPLDGPR
jgi:DNA-binding transcriptional regulator YiaG